MVAVAILEQSLLNPVFVESASVRQTLESTSANIRNMAGTDTDRCCLPSTNWLISQLKDWLISQYFFQGVI